MLGRLLCLGQASPAHEEAPEKPVAAHGGGVGVVFPHITLSS